MGSYYEKSRQDFLRSFSPTKCCPSDFVSSLIHPGSEEFKTVDAAGTRDFMIVAELWENGLDSAAIAHLLWWQCVEVLDRFGTASIFIDLPIGGNHRVMSGRGKLHTRNKEGDVAMIAAL